MTQIIERREVTVTRHEFVVQAPMNMSAVSEIMDELRFRFDMPVSMPELQIEPEGENIRVVLSRTEETSEENLFHCNLPDPVSSIPNGE